ncbi:MAG: 50S ribosomal protein L4 [Bacteroidales bacterium]|jgi:large subunit ribosomal protein L4|nr:50S ribosomal protein L4 [Bacteroidales bacterium]
MELTVYNKEGKSTGRTVVLNDDIFGIEPNDHAIYLDVKQIMANRRQGTHASKTRGLVVGSTRKLKRQKGSGGARAGDIKNPLFRGGGRVFGPQPRDYSFKLNKKVKSLARKSALSYKAGDEQIVVIENINFETPKTKDFKHILKNLELDNKKTLLVLPETNVNVALSARNLQQVGVINALSINTYDILNAQTMLVLEDSISKIEEMFA